MLKSVLNVLFVCIGNSCRSQMAEGFARKYGADVMRAWSAGLAPAPVVQPMTIEVMDHRNVDIRDQFPKSVDELELNAFDVIINMSGMVLPTPVRGDLRTWNVADPMAQGEEVYLRVRNQIEGLVMQMILDLRRGGKVLAKPTEPPVARPKLAPSGPPERTSESSQRYGFGRVRRSRD